MAMWTRVRIIEDLDYDLILRIAEAKVYLYIANNLFVLLIPEDTLSIISA